MIFSPYIDNIPFRCPFSSKISTEKQQNNQTFTSKRTLTRRSRRSGWAAPPARTNPSWAWRGLDRPRSEVRAPAQDQSGKQVIWGIPPPPSLGTRSIIQINYPYGEEHITPGDGNPSLPPLFFLTPRLHSTDIVGKEERKIWKDPSEFFTKSRFSVSLLA